MINNNVDITPKINSIPTLEIEVQKHTNLIKNCIGINIPLKTNREIEDKNYLPILLVE